MISPILSPVSAKLKNGVPAISKPQEGKCNARTHFLMHYFMLLYEEMHAYCSYSWNLSMAIPIIEIEVNVDMESDKKLNKLETFLGRLNSKGEHN